jgi:sec-independent protein translocase protein TatA
MEALSPFHLIIILAVIVLLFGGKKIPEVMRGLGEGIRNFKDGMNAPHPTSPSANPPANPPAAAPTVPPTPAATDDKK